MKANAPDKIYACFGVFGLIQATEIRATSKDIEYIREDAFIEKVCEWLLINASDYCILHNSYDTKELVKDFVDAMKRD